MELTQKVESINRQLADNFGIDSITGLPIWRVVWANNEFEKRLGTYEDFTPSGIYIRTVTEVREVPKYPFNQGLYVFERLVIVPNENKDELVDKKLSYEPMWVFRDEHFNYLPPKYEVCEFIIHTIYAAMGRSSMFKYVDPETGSAEERAKRVADLQQELFGNETSVGDALAHKSGVGYTGPTKES